MWIMFVSVEDTAVSSRIHNPDQLHNIEWYWVHLAMTGIDLTTLMIIGPDCIYKCKSNYHSIAAMTNNVLMILQEERDFGCINSSRSL
jgi:hypothetical protein